MCVCVRVCVCVRERENIRTRVIGADLESEEGVESQMMALCKVFVFLLLVFDQIERLMDV